jgi:hypothetical protein
MTSDNHEEIYVVRKRENNYHTFPSLFIQSAADQSDELQRRKQILAYVSDGGRGAGGAIDALVET